MIQQREGQIPNSASKRGITTIIPPMLAVALAAILLPLPEPAIQVNQPFKAELLLSLVLLLIICFRYLRPNKDLVTTAFKCGPFIAISFSILAFVFWSGSSVFWGGSFNSVAHHTLLWSVYLIYFLAFSEFVGPDLRTRVITSTFVIVSLILAALCLVEYLTISDFAANEGSLRIRYGKYAELLVTISPVLWAAAVYSRKRGRMLLLLLAASLSWITIMLSLSKGAFISGIAGFAIFFVGSAFFSTSCFRKRIFVAGAVWLALTIFIQVLFSSFLAVPATTSLITGASDPTQSTRAMRVFTWKVAWQMAVDHRLIGVGADNFGTEFNRSRAAYRTNHPDDPKDEIAEDYLVERAHNEPLQVLTELGVVGLLLFAMPFLIFGLYFLRKLSGARFRLPPVLWAAAAGMTSFALSSEFSSFSFRSAQNGVVFFMVLALGVNELAKTRQLPASKKAPNALAFGARLWIWLCPVLLIAYGLTNAFAEYQLYKGERSVAFNSAQDHFKAAIAADPEYAGAYLVYAARVAAESNHAESSKLMRKAIDYGIGLSLTYSDLAKQQTAAGDYAAAEATYREALAIYPRSVFIRTEFIIFLEKQGKLDEAAAEMAAANAVDGRQAKGWYIMIKTGSVDAFYRSLSDPNIAPPAELVPYKAVFQYLDKVPGMEPFPGNSDSQHNDNN